MCRHCAKRVRLAAMRAMDGLWDTMMSQWRESVVAGLDVTIVDGGMLQSGVISMTV